MIVQQQVDAGADEVDRCLVAGHEQQRHLVLDGALRTEDFEALPGITRGLVLDASAGLLPIVKQAVRASDVPSLSEMFSAYAR